MTRRPRSTNMTLRPPIRTDKARDRCKVPCHETFMFRPGIEARKKRTVRDMDRCADESNLEGGRPSTSQARQSPLSADNDILMIVHAARDNQLDVEEPAP